MLVVAHYGKSRIMWNCIETPGRFFAAENLHGSFFAENLNGSLFAENPILVILIAWEGRHAASSSEL